jgi:hypothetical protein
MKKKARRAMSKVKEAISPMSLRGAKPRSKPKPKEEIMPKSKIDEAVSREKTKEGLPREAFAIPGDPDDPESWKLPHHTKAIFRALQGRLDIEKTVDWDRMPAAVAALSPGGYRGERVKASPEEIIKAARHLAAHYEKAGRPVPDTLGALI